MLESMGYSLSIIILDGDELGNPENELWQAVPKSIEDGERDN